MELKAKKMLKKLWLNSPSLTPNQEEILKLLKKKFPEVTIHDFSVELNHVYMTN